MCVRVSIWLRACSVLCVLFGCTEVTVRCCWLSPYRGGHPAHLTTCFIPPCWQLLPLTASWNGSWNSTAPCSSSQQRWDHLSAPELVLFLQKRKKGGKRKKGEERSNFHCALLLVFFFFLFPFEVVRHSFKPHCTPTLCTRESVMNMYQHSIWQQ